MRRFLIALNIYLIVGIVWMGFQPMSMATEGKRPLRGMLATQPDPSTTARSEHMDITGTRLVIVGDLVPNPTKAGSMANARAVRNITASLNPDLIIHLGDLQYECGTPAEYAYYDSVYRDMFTKIAPVIGNHEYCGGKDPNATGYFGYFGSRARPSGASYYSFNVNLPGATPPNDHVLVNVLNSNCQHWNKIAPGCGLTQAMSNWFRASLDQDHAKCEIAVWHQPAFGTQVPFGEWTKMRTSWHIFQNRGGDLVGTGHAHHYEYLYPQTYQGVRSFTTGVRSIISGAGGRSVTPITTTKDANSFRIIDDRFGVTVINLTPTSMSTRFVDVNGGVHDPHVFGCR